MVIPLTFALLALPPRRVMLAVARHLAPRVHGARGRVAVALAPTADGQVGDTDPVLAGVAEVFLGLDVVGVLLLVASSGAAEHPVEVALSIERSSLLREFRYGAQLCDGASHPKGSTLGSVPQSGKGAGGASPPEKR